MKGAEIIEIIKGILSGEELLVSSNGNVSRQTYHLLPKPQLYLRGSMGLPIPIGLGLALAKPEKTVITITGDGNFLMGLSSIATLSYVNPPNLKIVILDNQAYATTGGQKTVSTKVNYVELLKGVNINNILSIDCRKENNKIEDKLTKMLEEDSLSIVHILIEEDVIELENIPWHPVDIAKKFKNRQKG